MLILLLFVIKIEFTDLHESCCVSIVLFTTFIVLP